MATLGTPLSPTPHHSYPIGVLHEGAEGGTALANAAADLSIAPGLAIHDLGVGVAEAEKQ